MMDWGVGPLICVFVVVKSLSIVIAWRRGVLVILLFVVMLGFYVSCFNSFNFSLNVLISVFQVFFNFILT